MRLISRAEMVAAARSINGDVPLGMRLLQSLRPYICPFEHLLAHVPAGASVLDAGCGAGVLLARQWIKHRYISEVRGWASATGATAFAEGRVNIGSYGHELLGARRS